MSPTNTIQIQVMSQKKATKVIVVKPYSKTTKSSDSPFAKQILFRVSKNSPRSESFKNLFKGIGTVLSMLPSRIEAKRFYRISEFQGSLERDKSIKSIRENVEYYLHKPQSP
jgi:hypothetical protein